ncbi:MAG: anthranilate phosphoribosyltransferase [bacterium]|nr:anthranilate phosphoribosyltransferase [bacterium]
MSFAEVMNRLLAGEALSEDQSGEAISSIMSGELTPVQVGALLTALRARGETLDEIVGAARAMRSHALAVAHHREGVIDTCGTGGDGSGTFNISTTTAFIVAGAGAPVAKHGNRSASSRCGSIDLLERLGVDINQEPENIAATLDETGMAVLFARVVHPAMKFAGPVRAELGFRTIFNFLGPLTNPARPDYQLVGVGDGARLELYANCLLRLGVKRAWVAHGAGGLDEVSLTGASRIAEVSNGAVRVFDIHPDEAGLPVCDIQELQGGDPERNAAITMAILRNEEHGPMCAASLLNAGAALTVAERAPSLREGVVLARQSLESGAALGVLTALQQRAKG